MNTITNNKNQAIETNGKKPKIAILHYSGPPIVAGVELIMRDQARMFRLFNYKVSLVVGTGKQFRKDIPVHKIKKMDTRNKYILKIREELSKNILSNDFHKVENDLYKKLKKYLVEQEIGICIVHNAMTRHYNLPLTSALIKLSNDLPNIKFIAWVHDITFSDITYLGIPKSYAKSYPWSLLVTPLKNWQYVTISDFRKKELIQTFENQKSNKLLTIPNGIDVEKFLGLSPQLRTFYQEIDGLNSDLIACTPVRIVKRKNLELGIRIAHAMIKKGINFKLIITANRDHNQSENQKYYEELKELIQQLKLEKTVYFLTEYLQKINTEKKSQDIRVSEIYGISDLLLMTSSIEGFGLPLIEAGLARTPIFSTDIIPFHEIGTTNINYFYLKEDPEKIASMILSKMKSLPQAYFYRKVIKKYSFKTIFKNLILPLIG